ncbi:BsuPI-related putative proteinase inhibitor [Halosegnis sp.]|uniref:BsuPI-related putative proteinase inhibitor n=1 Tax=Halosegnis sp. TaxID=2864959 RepID=UPI0035D47DAA
MLDGSLTVTVGDGVVFKLTVTNAGPEPVSITFRDALRADFAVYAAKGTEVWRHSDGRLTAQALAEATFAPGETAIFAERWPAPEPGDYTAVGELRLTGDDRVRAETPFSV